MKKSEAIQQALEFISQRTEGSCYFCSAEEFPVKGQLRGYEEVSAEDAEEYHIDHSDDCPVRLLESLRNIALKTEQVVPDNR
jgi:hypothetical protein